MALAWYVGEARPAAAERWAFAFSAKKDWRSKVASDIAKIVATGRGYAKAFFVSNQFVPDKTRAKVEDALRVKHGIDVRILDRSWILERVFTGHHEQMAIDALRLQVSTRTLIRKGPFDVRREQELESVDAEVERCTREGQVDPILVDKMLQSALLARGLERPRHEVEGRLARAQHAARDHGSQHQCIIIAYQDAFGAFWWYEDARAFFEKLKEFEAGLVNTNNVYHFELATTLWMALSIAVQSGRLSRSEVQLDERADSLLRALNAAAGWQDRPSSALLAHALSLQIRLVRTLPGNADELLTALSDVIQRSAGLLGFPLPDLVESITDMSAALGDRAAFNDLHQAAITAISERHGELTAARLLLKRGAQELDSNRSYEAISYIGKALTRLYKDESQHDLVCALCLLGAAYENVGLLWAARGSLLSAASVAAAEFWRVEEVTSAQAACYDRLRWLELRLGRVPHALSWHEVARLVKGVLARRGVDPDRLALGDREFDGTLGILLLRTDLWELKWLAQLPDVLDRLGLPWAALTLRFALGYEDEVKKDLTSDGEDPPDLNELFEKLASQPAAADLPPVPALYVGRTASLMSQILGCSITAETEVDAPCMELAESILAALEGMLATGLLGSSIIAHVPSLAVHVSRAEFVSSMFAFDVQDRDGQTQVDVRVADWSPHKLSLQQQNELHDRLVELLVQILVRVFYVQNAEHTLVTLIRDERVMERAVNFTGSFVTVSNVLGNRPKHSMCDWFTDQDRAFPLRRAEPCITVRGKPPEQPGAPLRTGKGDPPAEFDWRRAKHTDIRTFSLIQVPLWDDANWFATVFMTGGGEGALPILAPVFRKADAARAIFQQWRRQLGEVDEQEQLRVSIIRGVSTANPHAYRIMLGTNPDFALRQPSAGTFFVMVSRTNQMDATSSENLDRFLASYALYGAYYVLPAVSSGEIKDLKLGSNAIRKCALHVLAAWQVGQNDPESAAIVGTDEPIVPPDHEHDAPVLAVLKKRRSG